MKSPGIRLDFGKGLLFCGESISSLDLKVLKKRPASGVLEDLRKSPGDLLDDLNKRPFRRILGCNVGCTTARDDRKNIPDRAGRFSIISAGSSWHGPCPGHTNESKIFPRKFEFSRIFIKIWQHVYCNVYTVSCDSFYGRPI